MAATGEQASLLSAAVNGQLSHMLCVGLHVGSRDWPIEELPTTELFGADAQSGAGRASEPVENAKNARLGPAIGHSVYDVIEAVTWREVAKPVLTQIVAESAKDGRAKMFWEHGATSMAWNKKLPPRGKLLQGYGRPQNNTAAEVANGRWPNNKTKPVIGRCTVRPEMAWNYDATTIGSEMRKPFLAAALDFEVSCNQTRYRSR